jgi:hypothetical protein
LVVVVVKRTEIGERSCEEDVEIQKLLRAWY